MSEQPQASNIQLVPQNKTKWDGATLLIAHNCVLLERFTGKRYTYYVMDIKTGIATYVAHRINPIRDKSIQESLILKILTPSTTSSGANQQNNEEANKKVLADTLTQIFKTYMPQHGFTSRSDQLALAINILEVICRRRILLSEAGVGIGKTHAYIIAAILVKQSHINDSWLSGCYPDAKHIHSMPVVIATSSIALQNAIAKEYIPQISKILVAHGLIRKPMTGVIRKGKEHYLCEKRLRLYRDSCKSPEIRQMIQTLIGFNGSIDLGTMDFLTPYIKRQINVKGSCNRNCSLWWCCRYAAFLNNAQSDKYDFQICNHNYLLADAIHRSKGLRPLIPNYQAVIIDEAHKLLPAAQQMYSVALSNIKLIQIAKTIRGFVFQQGQSTAALLKDTQKLEGQGNRLFRVLTENIPVDYGGNETERFKTYIDTTAERHLENMRGILVRLRTLLEERSPMKGYKSRYSYMLWELANTIELVGLFLEHKGLIYWIEKPGNVIHETAPSELLLCALPIQLGNRLFNDLWRSDIPVVLTSGTLSASGNFEHVKLGLGLDKSRPGKIAGLSYPSPFNYEENVLMYISETVPFPDIKNKYYIQAVTEEIERLVIAAHGHAAILFTSYRMMELVFNKLKAKGLQYPLFLLGKNNLAAIARFRQSKNGVLFASGSMWEGIDLPGDILSLLVIVRLPFAVPDPIRENEQAQFEDINKYKNTIVVPEMLVKLKQGVGRLIRSEADTGVVALLDSRVREGGPYRDKVLQALTKCRITSEIMAVTNFIKTKKEPAYFR